MIITFTAILPNKMNLSKQNYRRRISQSEIRNSAAAEKYHAEALCAEATSFNFAECKNWRCFLGEVRTFFDENPNS